MIYYYKEDDILGGFNLIGGFYFHIRYYHYYHFKLIS